MRIVIKIGSSTLAHATGRLNVRFVEQLCKIVSDIKNAGHEVIMVSSGAVGMGMGKLNLKSRPSDMATKQACAAIGQCELMYIYDKLFTEYNHITAQILLTGADIEHSDRCKNLQNTFGRLLEMGALPIINENDSVSTDEMLEIGDNDTLSAIVACVAKADMLVILSDIDGLYDCDPRKNPNAKLVSEVHGVTSEIYKMAGGAGSKLGTGGMTTKLKAAGIVNGSGIDMVIINGQKPQQLYEIIDGKSVGTKFIHTENA